MTKSGNYLWQKAQNLTWIGLKLTSEVKMNSFNMNSSKFWLNRFEKDLKSAANKSKYNEKETIPAFMLKCSKSCRDFRLFWAIFSKLLCSKNHRPYAYFHGNYYTKACSVLGKKTGCFQVSFSAQNGTWKLTLIGRVFSVSAKKNARS